MAAFFVKSNKSKSVPKNDESLVESSLPAFEFWKYQGAGNDFVVINNFNGKFDKYRENIPFIRKICDRNFGVGGDGLIEISKHPDYNYEMRFYNSKSGSLTEFCGNGARCSIAFAKEMQLLTYNEATFLGFDGPHLGVYDEINQLCHIQMGDVEKLTVYDEDNYFLHTGACHYVKYVDDLPNYDVITEGRKIRESKEYEIGTNVNFVSRDSHGNLCLRTFEKGVEDETLSCGTGSVATAIVDIFRAQKFPQRNGTSHKESGAAEHNFKLANFSHKSINEGADTDPGNINVKHVTLHTRGAVLHVVCEQREEQKFTDIFLIGPAKQVFHGFYNL